MRYFSSVIVLALMLGSAVPVFSHGRPPLAGEAAIEVVSDSGEIFRGIPFRETQAGRTRIIKKYLEAKKGENYGVIIRNNTSERIGLVIAVDGRNIISGKQSDLGRQENMYVLNAYEHARYDGWRTSNEEVHRFYFTEPADSYSVRTFADSSAMGVIAVAVFREKKSSKIYPEQKKMEIPPSAPSARGAAPADESAGTGFGDARYSPVITVAFEPERVAWQKMLVKYEWRETLCGKGILRCGRETGNRLWDEPYAPYPPGYQEKL